MPHCQFPVFCCFCVLEKKHGKYSQKWTKQKPKFLFFPRRDEVQIWEGGEPEDGHTPPMAWATPWLWRGLVWAPSPPADVALSPIYSPQRENLKPQSISTKHTTRRRRHQRDTGRVRKLFPAPCRRGESPPEAFFITMHAFGVMCE
jgi:hypothetical protein